MNTKKLTVTAMGVALFVVLTMCLQVPVFENYYLCLGYVVMMVYCFYFGAFSAMTVGFLGVVLYCVLTNGLRGMPGWAVGNLVIGLLVSMACEKTAGMEKQWLRWGIIGVVMVAATALGILGVKSFVEMVLYAQPMPVRVAKNVYAFVADVAIMWLSLPVCVSLEKTVKKLGLTGTHSGP